ncbi:MAG TPA: CRISPR-associated helicase Cas3' [Syntrophomonas sp.]|nr:CRISPR-associated helicase Cas3' [Syntrophomonas sp.]
MKKLSLAAQSLWAKKSKNSQDKQWLPLIIHMSDAAEIARLLWRDWLPDCTKREIAFGISKSLDENTDFEDAGLRCLVFLASGHDFGKATPAFQSKSDGSEFDEQLYRQLIDVSLPLPSRIHPLQARHYWASQVILERLGYSRKLAVILGGHHGQPPSNKQLNDLAAYKIDLGWAEGQEGWSELQSELVAYALELAGVPEREAQSWEPDITAQVLLSGLVIMVDWIVSNEEYFPYIDLSERAKLSDERAQTAWEELDLPDCWSPGNAWMDTDFYKDRFDIEPRPLQTAILQILGKALHPGMVILEAPMGEGKTEAALAAAELMAYKTRRSGTFFALPTQATANGLFLRICRWIERLKDDVDHAVHLAHGKADLNKLYAKIKKDTKEMGGFWVGGEEGEETGADAVIVHEWFSGRKKGILADFVIGTIDQVLMGGLKQKHLALRHLGLANKVVILDECHAYDAYMSQYLYKVLNWLGAYHVPVIVLSATLPGDKRKQLIDAYLKDKEPVQEYDPVFDKEKPKAPPPPAWENTRDYPIITYTDDQEIFQEKIVGKKRSLNVEFKILPEDAQIMAVLEDLLAEGGCAGIIVNTVKRAQEIARTLSLHFGEDCVELLHSRFIAMDRAQKEKELLERLGPGGERPERVIVVGTQIFEQSCDLDFDVLISDICPMDLLIQRIGRLHRHERNRPRPVKLQQAVCYITGMAESGFERGAELIYGKYLLMNTRALLPSKITLPDDISDLVQEAYRPDGLAVPPELQMEYQEAKAKEVQRIAKKAAKASTFQISDPYKRMGDLVGWLDTSITDDPSGKRGEAAVRDIEESLEVLVIQRHGGEYRMLPWLAQFKGRKIPADVPPDAEVARAIAECSVQLPRALCWKIDDTIKELEKIALHELGAWQQSSWLKGELFLILDDQLSTELCGYHLQYDRRYGMLAKKLEDEGDVDGRENI